MKQTAALIAAVAVWIVAMTFVVLWTISVYQECRQTNSTSYCLRLIG